MRRLRAADGSGPDRRITDQTIFTMNRLFALCASGLLLASCAGKTGSYELIPYPNHLTPRAGEFAAAGAAVACDERLDEASRAVVEEFAARLSEASGAESAVTYEALPAAGGFRFLVDESLAPERYRLDVTTDGAEVRASSLRGFLYAVQTIKQLLPAALYGGAPAVESEWTLPCVEIDDAPRFGYRGLMLDVARHFEVVLTEGVDGQLQNFGQGVRQVLQLLHGSIVSRCMLPPFSWPGNTYLCSRL